MARYATLLNLPPMPWVRYIYDVAHEVDPVTGWWCYDEVVITVPRQAGKTTLKIPIYVHRLSTLELGELWMTAQSGKKALKRWNNVRLRLERSPVANRIKSKVSITHEQILWKPTGSTLVPFTPNSEEMHGESPDLVDVDEWWAFDAVAAAGLKESYSPGFLTKNAQVWKTSTTGTSASAGLNADIRAGRAAVEMGRRSGTAYFEWSVPDEVGGVPIDELPDLEMIEACIAIHPAIGFHPTAPAERMRHRIRSEFGPGQENKLDRNGFLRAYGNRTANLTGGWLVIPRPAWVDAMTDKAIPPDVPVGLGFDVDPDGRDAAIAAAWRRPDGAVLIEVIKVAAGALWLPGSVVGLTRRWDVVQTAVNNAGPARDQADKIEAGDPADTTAGTKGRRPLELLRISQPDYGAACERYRSLIVGRAGGPGVLHIGQPEYTAAVEHAQKRRIGADGAWGWGRASDVSVTPLVAGTAALWALDHPRPRETFDRFKIR